jgi:tetrahydromethanopterin S-methyltransferase subunit G
MAHRIEPENVTRSRDEHSLGELFSRLTNDITVLFRQEVALAKAELTQKAVHIGRDIGFLLGGAAVVYAGFLALLAALIIGLGQAGLTWWASALIVGIIVTAGGGFLVWKGLDNLQHEQLVPEQTLDSLKEDAAWAKTQTT